MVVKFTKYGNSKNQIKLEKQKRSRNAVMIKKIKAKQDKRNLQRTLINPQLH
jgi:hypothetical protein